MRLFGDTIKKGLYLVKSTYQVCADVLINIDIMWWSQKKKKKLWLANKINYFKHTNQLMEQSNKHQILS